METRATPSVRDHAMWAPRHITTTTCKRQPVHGLISRFFKIIYFINCLNFIIIFNYLKDSYHARGMYRQQ